MTTEADSATGEPARETFQNGVDEMLSETVVRAVAATSGRSTLASERDGGSERLDPLYEAIDPDALDALFDGRDGAPRATGTVEFAYCGFDVTVERSGAVTVRER